MKGKRRDLEDKTRKSVFEHGEMGFRAPVETLASIVTGGAITVMRANELSFLDLVVGRWSFHSVFSIF